MRVVFVGAGNLATRLSLEMRKSGMSIGQVYSHTSEHAKILADELGCGWTVIPEEIVEDADLSISTKSKSCGDSSCCSNAKTFCGCYYRPN